MSAVGLDSVPLFVGANITGPTEAGVIVNVCGVAEPVNVRTMGVLKPPPLGVMVIIPVYEAFGVTVKSVETTLRLPPLGPVNVKLFAGANGVTELDADDAALLPAPLVAVTVQV